MVIAPEGDLALRVCLRVLEGDFVVFAFWGFVDGRFPLVLLVPAFHPGLVRLFVLVYLDLQLPLVVLLLDLLDPVLYESAFRTDAFPVLGVRRGL